MSVELTNDEKWMEFCREFAVKVGLTRQVGLDKKIFYNQTPVDSPPVFIITEDDLIEFLKKQYHDD